MATIDLGKIKFNWRGTYAGGTAYVPDDVVYYMDGSVGSSYMCVANTTGNAPSSGGTTHASWEYLAKGQATSPTTTQGDIIVRGASADGRLAIGSAGQALKVNSSANGLEYGTAGGVLQVKSASLTQPQSISSSGVVDITGCSVTITPSSSSNKILVLTSIAFGIPQGSHGGFRVMRDSTPIDCGTSIGSRMEAIASFYGYNHNEYDMEKYGSNFLDAPGDTNAHTYKLQAHTALNTNYTMYINRQANDSNNAERGRAATTITVMEISGGVL